LDIVINNNDIHSNVDLTKSVKASRHSRSTIDGNPWASLKENNGQDPAN